MRHYGDISGFVGVPASFDHIPRFRWTRRSSARYRRIMNTEEPAYAPLTGQSLAQRRQRTLTQCLVAQYPGAVSHITALDLWMVERPDMPQPDDIIHTTVHDETLRQRNLPGVQVHVWQGMNQRHITATPEGVRLLSVEAAWASMAVHLRIDQLVELAESCIRHQATTLARLRDFVAVERFRGRETCRKSLGLVVAGSASPKETQLRLCLYAHGLQPFVTNYTVPDIATDNGGAIMLDLADPELRIGIEYDGDHHRTDKHQWRRDTHKRMQLSALGWSIVSVTQLDLDDESRRARLAMNIAMIRARKTGRPVRLTTPLTWRELADCRRLWSRGASEG
jgi:hypothetical protein